MIVKFLQDFRGKLTKEVFFLAGQEAEFEAAIAEQLIADGRAEPVEVVKDTQPTKRKRSK